MARSNAVVSFRDLKVGEKFQLVGKRDGVVGRKPIFTKASTRAYTTRLGDRVETRAAAMRVKKVAR